MSASRRVAGDEGNMKLLSYQYMDPTINMRQSQGLLMFIMGILIHRKLVFISKQDPGWNQNIIFTNTKGPFGKLLLA